MFDVCDPTARSDALRVLIVLILLALIILGSILHIEFELRNINTRLDTLTANPSPTALPIEQAHQLHDHDISPKLPEVGAAIAIACLVRRILRPYTIAKPAPRAA
jgi:hypothetical protein